MPMISRKTIRRIKENVRIDDVFEWLGAKVVRRGSTTMAFCPFCDDAKSRNPACSLDTAIGLYHCFRCGNSGDTITAVMEHEDCSFSEALLMLADRFKIPVEYDKGGDPEGESRRKRQVAVLEDAQAMFLSQRSDSHWSDFVAARHLTQDACDAFGLGLSLYSEAPKVVSALLERHSKEDVLGSGIAYEKEGTGDIVLRFKNRITYPIRTAPGTLIGFGGRDITGRSNAKYVNSPESELFKKRSVLYGIDKARRAISKTGEVVVCEGYMDTIALATHGFPNVVGAMGTALTTHNLKYLSNFCDTMYISLDADEAGVSAAMRTVDNLPEGMRSEIRVVSIPQDVAKDPDEFFNEHGKTKDDFASLMEDADDLYLFCVKHIVESEVAQLDAMFAEGANDPSAANRLRGEIRSKAGDFMSRHYRKMDTYKRSAIASWLIEAGRLLDYARDLDEEWRRGSRFKQGWKSGGEAPAKDAAIGTFGSEISEVEDVLIGTLYHHPETRDEIKRNISDIDAMFTSATRRSIFEKLYDGFGKKLAADEIRIGFDDAETRECARILTSKAVVDGKDELGPGTVSRLCLDIQKTNLERMIDHESNAADPDLGKMLELKVKLADILERMQEE